MEARKVPKVPSERFETCGREVRKPAKTNTFPGEWESVEPFEWDGGWGACYLPIHFVSPVSDDGETLLPFEV